MKNIFTVIPLLALAACNSMYKETSTLPSGKIIHTVSCSGYVQTIAACKTQAEKLCKNGYEVHKNLSHRVSHPYSDDGFQMAPREYLAVECNQT